VPAMARALGIPRLADAQPRTARPPSAPSPAAGAGLHSSRCGLSRTPHQEEGH